jgi:predicted metal-dependent phosphoesterase TrpH
MVKWNSSYSGTGIWCKGAIHVHTANSHCGKMPLAEVLAAYGRKRLNYDFVCITDHDYATELNGLSADSGLILIQGVEESLEMRHIVAVNVNRSQRLTEISCQAVLAAGEKWLSARLQPDRLQSLAKKMKYLAGDWRPNYDQVLYQIYQLVDQTLGHDLGEQFRKAALNALGDADYQGMIDQITQSGGLAILAHPHWQREDYWEDIIDQLSCYSGIEIYNGDAAAALTHIATDTWDRQLSQGNKIWGYGGDDFHNPDEFNRVWNVVQVAARNKCDIVKSLGRGDFYVSTGVLLSEIHASSDTISISVCDDSFTSRYEKIFRFIGKDGQVLQTQRSISPHAAYKSRGHESYVRVHVLLETGQMAYTQPFFLNSQ